VRQAANEPTHFEPAADYLEELIEEDHRRAVRRRIGWITGLIVVIALMAAALFGAYAWTQTRYFVGVAPESGNVAIFQGIQQDLGPIPLSHVYEDTGIKVSDLPAFYQSAVKETTSANTLTAARTTVESLRAAAKTGKTP
jgi:protein phosphatase